MATNQANFSQDDQAVDVLIVGAGPTGLTLASDLLRRKVSFRMIEKASAATTISKAIVVHARNLEMFENLKVVEPFLKAGLALRGSNIFADGKRIVHLNLDEIDSHFKFALTIPQDQTEKILADHLVENGVAIERNKELLSFVDDADGVSASVACTAGDGSIETEIIKAKYLIGCDGAHSAVRHTLDLRFTGVVYDESFGVADVKLEALGASKLAHDEGYVYLSEDGLLACFPFGNGRYRLIFDMPPLGKDEEKRPLIFEEVLALVKKRGPQGSYSFSISDPHWMAWFKINRRCVTSYRKGRVFLAGDSAHIHSPVGGVGMNTGMQDAANLGWKLALAVKEQAGDFLLDSYHLERHAVGQAVLEGTDFATRAVTLRSPVAKDLRNSLMGFLASQEIVQQRILKAGSLTGVSYRKSPLSKESHASLKELLERNLPFAMSGQTQNDTSGENPTMLSWLDFARAPLAGDRMVDRECQTRHGDTRLALQTASPNFQLLLFDGFEASTKGYEQFLKIEKMMQVQFFGLVDVHVILPYTQNSPEYHANYATFNTYTSVLFDSTKELHRAYGASSECLYLIRPDGYIGFRSQPVVAADLENYLKSILKLI